MVTSWPGWTGTVWAFGCKHLASAEALFERRAVEVSPGDYTALLLIDPPGTSNSQIQRTQGPSQNGKLVRLVTTLVAQTLAR
jgi:hypothetical protein